MKQRKVSIANYIIYSVLFAALLALNGALNFVVAEFDAAIFREASYWFKTVTGALSGLAAFMLFAFMRRDTLTIKDQNYITKSEELNKTINGHVDQTIREFIDYKNYQSKRQTWIEKTSNQLQRYMDRTPQRILDIIYMSQYEEIQGKDLIKYRKWEKKKLQLEERLSEDWMERNLRYRIFKYPRISVSEVVSGTSKVKHKTKIINENAIGQLLRDRLPVIIINVGLQSIYNALIITQADNAMEMIVGIIFQLITIFSNIFIGMNYGRTLFAKIDVANLDIRTLYLAEYLVWRKEKKEVVSASCP